jgi:hypothetical protein
MQRLCCSRCDCAVHLLRSGAGQAACGGHGQLRLAAKQLHKTAHVCTL